MAADQEQTMQSCEILLNQRLQRMMTGIVVEKKLMLEAAIQMRNETIGTETSATNVNVARGKAINIGS